MHLEEDVAELVLELGVVAAVSSVGELIGLLDGMRDDRALVLLAIPRTLAPQAAGNAVQARDGLRCAARLAGLRAGAPPARPPSAALEPACGRRLPTASRPADPARAAGPALARRA